MSRRRAFDEADLLIDHSMTAGERRAVQWRLMRRAWAAKPTQHRMATVETRKRDLERASRAVNRSKKMRAARR